MIKMFKYLLLFLIGSQFAGVTSAQSDKTIIIEGFVESNIGNPIANAKVEVMDLGNSILLDSTITDMYGFYHLELTILTVIEKIEELPNSFSLSQNYPNPFSENTNISFSTEIEGNAKLEIFNIIGQKIITLFDNYISPNKFLVSWNGRNFNGNKIANRMYIYRLTLDNQILSKKMLYSNGEILAPNVRI